MKMKWFRVRRILYTFKKDSGKLVRQYELPHFNLREIQKLFAQQPGDLMYYSYPITKKEAPYFRKKYGKRFHFKKHEYFLDCERKG